MRTLRRQLLIACVACALSAAAAADMQAFMTARRMKPVVEKVYPLDQLDEAMKQLAENRFVGRIVVEP